MTKENNNKQELNTDVEAMDRLRDRTDELELIISSLTIFALLTIPGWFLEQIARVYTHLSTGSVIAASVVGTLLSGVCYVLAACFIVHLMARAYWVGLIGLRAAFPDGINWSKTPGLGPMSRKYYRETLPDIDTVIQKTDRLASSLFAVISMLTLSVLWFGVILVTTLVIAGTIGSHLGLTNTALTYGSVVLLALFLGGPVLVYLLDAQLAERFPRLCDSRFYVRLTGVLRRVAELAYPQRLVLPVQLTLQSNTRPFLVFLAIAIGVGAIVIIGNTKAAAWRNFTVSGEFKYLGDDQVQNAFRSTYYEDMPGSTDELRGWPRISSFTQSGAYVRLFLPYQPLRDNLILRQFCTGDESPEVRTDCLRKLWRVTIGDTEVPMSSFVAAERADINMRGLIGLVPMAGLEAGMQVIVAEFNPLATEDDVPIDDRYSQVDYTYNIPFALVPGYEMSLQDQNSGVPID